MEVYRNTSVNHTAYVWGFQADEDGSFYIPSLAYAGAEIRERHFSADDSGFNDPASLFEVGWGPCYFVCTSYQGMDDSLPALAYESFDSLNDALHFLDNMEEGGYAHYDNAHAVMGIPQYDADGKLVEVTLCIYW